MTPDHMSQEQRIKHLWHIAKLAQSGICLLGHVDVLQQIEDHPALVGLDGILETILTLAADLADDAALGTLPRTSPASSF